ncbi:putative SNF2 family domain-containing protein [Colletotrichum sublineola]|uniref:Putative SNF2 family domain-containing protein n=1 Tax=Colletotrichum sublineola TaxID=1173701 RepID=A0A066XD40_COLSU|nr:putative SNF2 family domain-containing protein [Colletotrichum sublineola]
MSSTADDQAKSGRQRNGLFLMSSMADSDSDNDMASHSKIPRRANRHSIQEYDVFDESIEDSINTMRNENNIPGNAGHTACPSQSVGSVDLFVTNTEGPRDTALPEKDDIEVKSEPASDDGCDLMVIDQAEASSGAQAKWSEPRPPFVIDLVTAVKQEPLIDGEPMLPNLGNQSSLEVLERRKNELQSKAMQGALTSGEFEEMMHVAAQLSQAAKTPRIVALPDPDHQEQAPSQETDKKKQKRKAPVADAAEYWARREEEERERDTKGRGPRGGVHSNASRKAKRARVSGNNGSDLDDEQLDSLIEKMLRPYDAIQNRADQGDLPAAPTITATRKNDQLKQMREAAPEYFDKTTLDQQKRELRQATKSWGPHAVRCKDGKWEVKGLVTPLMNHQLIVGAWMMGQELRTTRNLPRGGILADAMGLGKTIESLSCIVGNQASDSLKEAGKGATLVVCPSGQMISQWKSEVKKHCSKAFSNRIVHFKAGDDNDVDSLAANNIVYNRFFCQYAYANYDIKAALVSFELKAKHRWAVSGTPLINASHEFYSYLKFIRCPGIGDFSDYLREYEAGPKSQTKHRKLGSDVMYRRTQGDFFLGQPILYLPTTHPTHQYLNLSAEEMVIFRMIERCFRNKLNQDLEDGIAESQVKCYLVMLLRLRQAATHPFLLEGMMGELFSLKDLQTTKEKLNALKGGPTVYAQIGTWNQRQKIANERMREVVEESEKMRQKELQQVRKESLEATNSRFGEPVEQDEVQMGHPQDRATTGNDAIVIDNSDEVDSQDEVEEDEDGMVPQKTTYPGLNPEAEVDNTVPITEDEPRLQPFGRGNFGLIFDMNKQIEYLERLKEMDNAVCVVCKARPPAVPVKGRCGCIFCGRCVMAHLANKGRNCPKCRRIIGVPRTFRAFNGDDTDEERENDASMPQENAKDNEYLKGFDHTGFQHPEDDKKDKKPIRFLQISDKKPGIPLTPSVKMTALKETVLRWQAEAPDDKIIIFSQFNVVMKIIGRILESENICFAYLSGKQNTEQRNKAVNEFQNGNKVKVLIVSLRAGGQCLNLTRGNRVILAELWWNHAVEQQAFARVFRIGQIKETHFVRFIVNTPLENRMLRMQVGKILRIDAALQDESARTPKIRLEDIASLLGKVTTRDNHMHIISDYSDDEHDDEDIPSNQDEESDLEGLVVPDDVVEYDDEEEDGLITEEE